MSKRAKVILACVASAAILFSGCNSASGGASKSTSSESKSVTIKFYGSDSQYNKDIVSGFEKNNPNIKVQIVPVDFSNAEQVIKTGISSGNPVDVSFFWGTQINTFVSSNMATDLTAYLTANNNEWKNIFIKKYIDAGKINGKYYAISYQPVIETIFYNKDLFKKCNLSVPTTWDELMNDCAVFQKNGVYGVGDWSGQQHQMLVFAYQKMADEGVLENVTSGKAELAGSNEAAGLRDCLTKLKNLYTKNYWYPGQGALTATQDQVQAAFYQQKIAMLFDAGSNLGTYEKNAKFNLGVMKFPLITKDSKYGVNIVTNALFIPSNSKHKNEAVKFIKYYTSDAGMTSILNSGRLPSTKSMESKITDKLMRELLQTTEGDNVVTYTQLQNLSPEMSSFMSNELVSSVCSGTSIDSALEQMESLRKEAISKSSE